jgi:hypothetical protein
MLVEEVKHYALCRLSCPLERQGVDEGIILRWILRKWVVGAWTGSSWLSIGTGGGQLLLR